MRKELSLLFQLKLLITADIRTFFDAVQNIAHSFSVNKICFAIVINVDIHFIIL